MVYSTYMMTNDELFTDLKQFITATISPQLANVATKNDLEVKIGSLRSEIKGDINSLRSKLESDISALDEKLDLIQDAIAEVFTATTKTSNALLQNHEQRLLKLERQSA